MTLKARTLLTRALRDLSYDMRTNYCPKSNIVEEWVDYIEDTLELAEGLE